MPWPHSGRIQYEENKKKNLNPTQPILPYTQQDCSALFSCPTLPRFAYINPLLVFPIFYHCPTTISGTPTSFSLLPTILVVVNEDSCRVVSWCREISPNLCSMSVEKHSAMSTAGWPSWLWRQVKVYLNTNLLVRETERGFKSHSCQHFFFFSWWGLFCCAFFMAGCTRQEIF
jgi:hypothetical protein